MRPGRQCRQSFIKLPARKLGLAKHRAASRDRSLAGRSQGARKKKARSLTRKWWMRRSRTKKTTRSKMGVFCSSFRVELFPDMRQGINVERGLVDTGAECTWVPAAELARMG